MENSDDICSLLSSFTKRLTNIEENIVSINNRLNSNPDYDQMTVSLKVKDKEYTITTFSNLKSRCRNSDNMVVLTFSEEFNVAQVQNRLMQMQRHVYIYSNKVLKFEYEIQYDYFIHWLHLGETVIGDIIDKCGLPLPETISVTKN